MQPAAPWGAQVELLLYAETYIVIAVRVVPVTAKVRTSPLWRRIRQADTMVVAAPLGTATIVLTGVEPVLVRLSAERTVPVMCVVMRN